MFVVSLCVQCCRLSMCAVLSSLYVCSAVVSLCVQCCRLSMCAVLSSLYVCSAVVSLCVQCCRLSMCAVLLSLYVCSAVVSLCVQCCRLSMCAVLLSCVPGEIREQQPRTQMEKYKILCRVTLLTFILSLLSPPLQLYTCPASPPPKLVDTLGAGDTFNAGLLHKLSTGNSVEAALLFACQLAGAKCGMLGFEGLAENFRNL